VTEGALLRSVGLRVGHRGKALLPAIDLAVAPGEILLIAGRNGSGKTTFVNTLLGLLRPIGGSIERRAALRTAYVPQVGAIDTAVPVRVGDLVGWGRQRGWSFLRPFGTRADAIAVDDALRDAGVADLRARRFGELSGGQRQKVLLARLLATQPELAVLDEPTAAMDTAAERIAFGRLHDLARERGLAALIVTHEVPVAARYADRIAFFDPDDPDGEPVAIGPVAEIAARPRFVAMFGRITGGGGGGGDVAEAAS
jgi:zinc transport system ATP-binding protein